MKQQTIAHALEKKERTIHGSKPVKAKSYANIAIIKLGKEDAKQMVLRLVRFR